MNIIKLTIDQFRKNTFTIMIAGGISVIILVLVQLLSSFGDIPIENLTRDPNAIGGAPLYNGILSQVGVLIWIAAAVICFYSTKIASGLNIPGYRAFLIYSAILSLWLGLDDMFLLHEEFFPRYIGLSETAVMVIYFLAVGYYLLRYFKIIMKTDFLILLYAIGFFGGSMFADKFIPSASSLFEDGLKFIGIFGWLVYFLRTCNTILLKKSEA